MKQFSLSTPLGPLVAIADEKALYHLEFDKTDFAVPHGKTPIHISIERELNEYFAGKRRTFQTPFTLRGTPFQQKVWRALLEIPYGETCSYAQLAQAVDNPKGFRAVGRANGTNPLPILIPCHRVISSDGALGGYSSGLRRKEELLSLESSHAK